MADETSNPARAAAIIESLAKGIVREDEDGEIVSNLPPVLPEGKKLAMVDGKVEVVSE